eukprot:CAMPEP_0172303206 /NCGR_PEP_ID=MMETSP1058-20130122/4781_1 /TAXON_ID=83371 /ORGANISM="Detonula confervacea, Strain CCMP 353" /LENGTH=71 /DNA_ID=CAMNT_0013013945 /DNA_START=1 /DNA_END=212 /DNA_ORIENTATION=+
MMDAVHENGKVLEAVTRQKGRNMLPRSSTKTDANSKQHHQVNKPRAISVAQRMAGVLMTLIVTPMIILLVV